MPQEGLGRPQPCLRTDQQKASLIRIAAAKMTARIFLPNMVLSPAGFSLSPGSQAALGNQIGAKLGFAQAQLGP